MSARLYKLLYRIRRVEEEIARVYPTDRIRSPVHLSIGQEAVSVGVCEALQRCDVVFGTYRGHALYLARGGDLRPMIAELFGRATGCTKGKGGSMHLIAPECGVMGTSAVVGTTIANAVGPACDYRLGYRTEDEAAPWMANDPVRHLASLIDPADRKCIEAKVEEEIAAAFAFAEASPFPGAGELTSDVFKEEEHAALPSR